MKYTSIVVLSSILISASCQANSNSEGLSAKPNEQIDRYWNDASRYLAGMSPEPDSTLAEIESRPEAEKHREFFKNSWSRVEKSKIDPLETWAEEEINDARNDKGTIFYAFSGPDFLNIHNFFPNGSEYVMIGLEPEGRAPDLRKIPVAELRANLTNIQQSLNSILNFSFFMTLHMEKDFRRNSLEGTAPILMVFVARTGHDVLDVRNVTVTEDATLTDKTQKGVHGVEITFRNTGSSKIQKLTYFSVDVSDASIRSKPYFFKYLKSKEPYISYLKAASYLMYRDTFTDIRNHILDNSRFIMQDDSGIPLRYFSREKFDLTFYGTYTSPIQLFQSRFQADLLKIYKDKNNVKNLPFGIGYKYRLGESNLMVARLKK